MREDDFLAHVCWSIVFSVAANASSGGADAEGASVSVKKTYQLPHPGNTIQYKSFLIYQHEDRSDGSWTYR